MHILVILDGFGLRAPSADNAITTAQTPHFKALCAQGTMVPLSTHGAAVGLPPTQMGNSEVGHMNIGAGRIALPEFGRIDAGLQDGSIEQSAAWQQFVTQCQQQGTTCHVLGMISDGGVHSHIDQVLGWLSLLKKAGIATVVHAITDGRDTPPKSALRYMRDFIQRSPFAIATLSGRYYAMDRDQRHERIALAHAAMQHGHAPHRASNALDAIEQAYARGESDEFIVPTVIGAYQGIHSNDNLLMTNFRADRARQILDALLSTAHFNACAGAICYSDSLAQQVVPIVLPMMYQNTLGEVIAKAGKTQLRVAETEKYAHVTFFLNGGQETPFVGEERILISSPKVATYDLQPHMSAPQVTDAVVSGILSQKFDFIVVNYANCDMVGHTGVFLAAVQAVEAVDAALGRIAHAAAHVNATLFITADHGNADQMQDNTTGQPHTQHTLSPVPFVCVDYSKHNHRLIAQGTHRLCDIAPTILQAAQCDIPSQMTGQSLLQR